MSKHIELRDDTRKISNLSITTSEIRRKFSTDWKPREIKTNGNRHNISTNQIQPFVYDSQILETDDTEAGIKMTGKKNTRIIIKTGKGLNQTGDGYDHQYSNQATQKKIPGSRKLQNKVNIQKLQIKIEQYEAENDRLKKQNSKLLLANKKFESLSQFKKQRSSLSVSYSSLNEIESSKRRTNNNIAIDIENKNEQVQKLKADIVQYQLKEKQNNAQKCRIYENINTRLKDKQIQCYNLTKQLREERYKCQQYKAKIQEYEIDIQKFNEMLQQSVNQITELSMKSKQQQEQMSKKSLLVGRIRYLENQIIYLNNQEKKHNQQLIDIKNKNEQLTNTNGQLRSQLSFYLSNPVHAPFAQVYSLAKQLLQKDVLTSQYLQQIKKLRPLVFQKKILTETLNSTNDLLQQTNDQLVKQRLQQMNGKFKTIRLS